jgi:hypothetical protein
MATKTLEIAIIGTNKSTKAFKEVDDAAGTTEGKLKQLGSAIGPAVATAAATVVAGVGFAIKSAWSAAEESAKIGRETERVLQTTGATAWTSADQVSALAQSISEVTGADDELIQSGANLLLTFTNVTNQVGKGNDIFDQATQLALDMSVALGTDMSSASIQLGKALNNPIKGITALSRAGVSFTEAQKDQITTLTESGNLLEAQKIILGELSKEFGGAAEAAATPLDKLKVKIGNLQESIGNALIPIVGHAADILSTLTDSFMALPGPVKAVAIVLGSIGTGAAGAVLLVSKLVSVFSDSLKPVMDFARTQIDNVALGIGNMATKMGMSQGAASNLASGLSSAVVPALGLVTAAATIGFGIWTMYQQSQASAAAKAKELTATLDENTGAVTANTRSFIEKQLTDRNQIDNLNKAKIGLDSYTAAIGDNSHKIAANRGEILEATIGRKASERSQDAMVAKLRDEGGARNELIATLIEQKALDAGLLDSIIEQSSAYDKNIFTLQNKVTQQAIATGANQLEAQEAANAAAANKRHADSIKEVADELRAQTDPYFAAFRSQQQLAEAQANKVNQDGSKSEADKKAAWMAVAQAAVAYKGDLLDLDRAAKESGATGTALTKQLDDLAQFGLDTTSQSAKNATGDLVGLGRTADDVGKKAVAIPVTLEMREVQRRLDWLRAQVDPATGTIGLGAIWEMQYHAKGGLVSDGMFMVGEQGPEIGVKSGSNVRIFSNPESQKILAQPRGDTHIIVNVDTNADPNEIARAVYWKARVTG